MGHVLHMVLIMIFFLISFYFTSHILIAKTRFNNAEVIKGSLYYTGHNWGGGLTVTVRVDQKQQQKALILEKFRLLLGLKSFSTGKSRNGGSPAHSPASSPVPSPVPSPAAHALRHPHHHHHHSLPQPHIIQPKAQKKSTTVIAAVLASVGITSVLCAIGLFVGCRKMKKQKRRQRTRGISKFIITSQSSVKKVSSDPGPDLFYLNSLESALEPETKCCLKITEKVPDDEREGSNKRLINTESDESGGRYSYSFGEITTTTVHEISESVHLKNEERIVIIQEDEVVQIIDGEEIAHSSDDESFHSFCNSPSPQLRLSNASSASSLPPSITPPPPPPPPTSPPPPPPPSISSSTRIKSNCLKSPPHPPSSSPPSPQQPPSSSSPPPPPPPPPPPSSSPPPPPSSISSLGRIESNALKAPPPPPSLFGQQMPLGKDGCPLPKLKPLHWDKVRAAPNRTTVWDKLRSSSFEFDEEMIESLFGYNLQNAVKNDEVKSKTPSPSKHVLEPKRLQNITILSKALNVTAEQVCGALIRGDGLSLQDLEALSKMVPTKEEEAKLANYKGDVLELGSAEKLVKAMLKIPFAFSRIEAMLYRETFEDEILHLRKSFSMLDEACKELRSSRLFLKLLEAVLKTGNRMNVGTIRGGAKAFKLDALLKLADVKGTDGKTTLLHFVVQEIIRSEGIRVSESIMGKIHCKGVKNHVEDKEERYRRMGLDLVSGLSVELCNAKKTATIDLDVLATSVTTLSEGIRKLQNLVEKDMINEERKGGFVGSMRSFLNYAETKLKELREDESRILVHVREITEYFHGDVSKEESNPLRIFVIVRDFLSMLDNVCKELRNSKVPRSPNPLAPFR